MSHATTMSSVWHLQLLDGCAAPAVMFVNCRFVWGKKIERDLLKGKDVWDFTAAALQQKHEERMVSASSSLAAAAAAAAQSHMPTPAAALAPPQQQQPQDLIVAVKHCNCQASLQLCQHEGCFAQSSCTRSSLGSRASVCHQIQPLLLCLLPCAGASQLVHKLAALQAEIEKVQKRREEREAERAAHGGRTGGWQQQQQQQQQHSLRSWQVSQHSVRQSPGPTRCISSSAGSSASSILTPPFIFLDWMLGMLLVPRRCMPGPSVAAAAW